MAQKWKVLVQAKSGLNGLIGVLSEAVNAYNKKAQALHTQLKEITDNGGYSPKQIFYMDKTGLYWKRMLQKTFISKMEKTAT